jgi:hypothetical protein
MLVRQSVRQPADTLDVGLLEPMIRGGAAPLRRSWETRLCGGGVPSTTADMVVRGSLTTLASLQQHARPQAFGRSPSASVRPERDDASAYSVQIPPPLARKRKPLLMQGLPFAACLCV